MLLSLNSCGTLIGLGMSGAISGNHTYLDGTSNSNDTKVILDKANFNVIGTAVGQASATYVFGIGGLSEQALKSNAIADMYKNANLTGSQAIIDVNFSCESKNILVYNQMNWTCQGIIIEFVDKCPKCCKE